MSSDGQDRTEKATPKRMKKARADGALGKSQDLSAWLGIAAAAIMMPSLLRGATSAATEQMATVREVISNPSPEAATAALDSGLGSVVPTMAPLFAVVAITAVVATAAQGGIYFSKKKLQPTFKQFNIAKGLKRTFGMQALWQGAKALLKTIVVGIVLYSVVTALTPVLLSAGGLQLSTLIDTAGQGVGSLVRSAVVAGLVLAAADVVVVMRRNRKQTRMTKREIKEEHKSSEGDPQLKSAIRSKQIAMSRNRMIASVADADVVLVNPTHVAVALKYEAGKGAPKVVAKGADHVAARIRERAAEGRVPMVEDVPLARALHAGCEVGQEIPVELYTAVAQVLAFVMALKRRGSGAGQHRMPTPTVVPEPPEGSPRARAARARGMTS